MFKINPLHALDSYKLGHPEQYPENTQYVYSNFTPRSDRLSAIPFEFNTHKLAWFGLQGTLKELVLLWDEEFFKKPKDHVLAVHARRTPAFTGNATPDLSRIAALHDLGYLPLCVKSLPEGSKVNMGIPVFTIVNTLPEFGWLTNSTETILSNESWKPATVATIARTYRVMFEHFANITGSPMEFVDWQGHCFADRGMSGMMDAAKSCAGHATSFLGSDSISSVDWLEYAYGAENTFVSGSVPATEHSVMCIGGMDSEVETIRRLIKDIYPSGVVSIVSDTWDFWNVITKTSAILKEDILSRTPNAIGLAKVVFRPDSGDPVKIIAGLKIKEVHTLTNWDDYDTLEDAEVLLYNGKYYEYEIDYERWDHSFEMFVLKDEVPEHIVKGAVECLWDIFGGTTTNKGFKVLNERVGLIYGDSITLTRANAILKGLADKGFASCNVVLGIGSYTYQYITRDTFGHAMKATYGVVDGVGREIFKDPATDTGRTKRSAKGLLRVEKEGDDYVLYDQQTPAQEKQGLLQVVFEDGKFYNTQTLDEIRTRLRA